MVTVQTTLLVVLVFVGGVLLLDSYKWRRISFPWSSGFSEGPYEVLDQQGSALLPPPTTEGSLESEDVQQEAPGGKLYCDLLECWLKFESSMKL